MHSRLVNQLKDRLQRALPGDVAHQRMASATRRAVGWNPVPNKRTRISAVLILLYARNNILHVPLIIRPLYPGVHSGQIALPGGRREETDRSVVDTALREAHEEIGVSPDGVDVLGQLSPLFIPVSNFMVHPVVGVATRPVHFMPDPREVAGVLEVPLSELQDVTKMGEKEIMVGDLSIQAPYYGVQGQTVWGATAMILSEFLAVVEEVL